MRDSHDTPPRDAALAALAQRQHGVLARGQLRALGFDKDAIARRVRAGRLHRVHPGVYAVGHACLTADGRYLAAVLACGPGAVLSHHSAASLWDLRASATARVDVTVPTTNGHRSSPTIRVHRTRRPPPSATRARTPPVQTSAGASTRPAQPHDAGAATLPVPPQDAGAATPPAQADEPRAPEAVAEATVHRGIPVTTVARTLTDLADTLRDRAIEKAVERAIGANALDVREVEAIAARTSGRRGPARLLRLLREHDAERTLTRSELEDALLELCDEHGVARPLTNVVVGGHEADFVWPDARLIVEADSWQHHRSRRAFEDDRRRDAEHTALGWRVVRLTHARVTAAREDVATLLLRLGAGRRSAAAPMPRQPRPRAPAAA